jgi:hypothetical protein
MGMQSIIACIKEYLNKSTAFTPEALIEAKER